MKINPPIKKYLAALIIGSVISSTCSNVCSMQVQKIHLLTPVKPGGIFNTSHYHSELFSQKCHFIRESSRKQFKDYCNSTPHNITYWHHRIDYTLLKCILTLVSIWMWAVHAVSIALMQDRLEDTNTVGDHPKRDSMSINKLFHCYHALYLFQLLFSWWKCVNNVTSWKIVLEKTFGVVSPAAGL